LVIWAGSEAEAEKRKVLKVKRRVLGEEHPDTLKTWGNWALSLGTLGRVDEALAELHLVLDARQRVQPGHPNTKDLEGFLRQPRNQQRRRLLGNNALTTSAATAPRVRTVADVSTLSDAALRALSAKDLRCALAAAGVSPAALKRAKHKKDLMQLACKVQTDKASQVAGSASDKQLCALCNKPGDKACSQCKTTYYCSAEHQREHWKSHKPQCKPSPK
jgi:MYND finger